MLVRIVERISQIAIWTCWAVECWQIGQVGWWLRCIFRHLYLNLFNHFTLILFSLPFSHRFPSFDGSPESKRFAIESISITRTFFTIRFPCEVYRTLSTAQIACSIQSLLDLLAAGSRTPGEMRNVQGNCYGVDRLQQNWNFARQSRRHLISLWSDSVGACNIIPR